VWVLDDDAFSGNVNVVVSVKCHDVCLNFLCQNLFSLSLILKLVRGDDVRLSLAVAGRRESCNIVGCLQET